MEQDKFALVEKIIKDVDTILTKNTELYAFDIVPVESNHQNKSPVLHLENCMGLESWCIKHVYMFCFTELMDNYFTKPKRKTVKVSSSNCGKLSKLLNVTLLLNPDLTTLWNKRREMLEKSLLDKTSELRFTKLVLSRKPKCNDAFTYRRWILETIFKVPATQEPNFLRSLISEELHVCTTTADRSPNNYHSWSHRSWMLNKLKTIAQNVDLNQIYLNEYAFSESWTSKHISDFSCFSYRQFCISNILSMGDSYWKKIENSVNLNLRKSFTRVLADDFPQELTVQASVDDLNVYSDEELVNLLLSRSFRTCDCKPHYFITCKRFEVLFHELYLNDQLSRFYKQHETLWYHRRFIVHEIVATMYDYLGYIKQNGRLVKNECRSCHTNGVSEKQAKLVRYDSNHVYSSVIFKVLLSHEKRFIEERREENDNFADRHEKYLKFVESLRP